jgi:hypothetical protein
MSMLRQHSRVWIIVLAIGFVSGHLILFHLWRNAALSHRTFSGIAISAILLVIVAKHLGLVAGLVRLWRTRFRRHQN